MVEARLSNSQLKSKITNYIFNRQNDDGGYTFAQGSLESSIQDTYYGLAILNQLNTNPPNPGKTLQFLDENRLDNIYSIYYATRAKLLLGRGINSELKKDINMLLNSRKYFGSNKAFSDVSEFKTTFMALELANTLKIGADKAEVAKWLVKFKNTDGGFGAHGHSSLDATYYAVACLLLVKENPKRLNHAVRFARECEKAYGGFTAIPMNFTPYMEYTYFGVMTLALLGEKCRYPSQTRSWVLSCQNGNGGFARSDLGISTFMDTYYALKILQRLGNQGNQKT